MPLFRSVALIALLGWILASPCLAQYNYHFGRNKIQYDDFDWKVMRTEHFDVYYYPEMLELAEHGAFFAEEAYNEMRHRFNFSLNTRVPIIFYSSNLHFKQTNITPGFIPDGVGGFFEFLKGRVVIPANGNLQRFRRVVRHEMVHVFTYNKLVRVMRDHRRPMTTFLPLWFTEGLAEYWSGPPDQQHEMVMRDAVFTNYLVPLESMFRIRGSYVMYKQGEAIMRFISEEYGEEKILALVEAFWKDSKFDVVLEVTLQEPFEDIAARWLTWVKRQYYPEMSEIDVPSLIASGLSTEGFNAKPSFHQFPDGQRFVYFVGNHGGHSNVYSVEVDAGYEPLGEPEVLIKGERSDDFEAFHLFESRIAVSVDGKLAFVTKSGNRDVIHVWDLYSNSLEDTYRFERIIAAYSPTWSPDGTAIAFTSIGENGFSDIQVLERSSGLLRPLTDDTWDDRDPSWSPDGGRIAFSSDRTGVGPISAYNIFTYDLDSGQIDYVTYGHRVDLSPAWSPDGRHVAFISSQPDSSGRFTGQDIWVADMTRQPDGPDLGRPLSRLTRLASAAMDPVWTDDNHLVFTAFEGLEFSIRHLPRVDSLRASPKRVQRVSFAGIGDPWEFDRIEFGEEATAGTYQTKYQLDIAQASVGQSSVLGTTGGALVAFSDMLGNDYLNFTLFNTGTSQRSFLEDLSFQVAKYDFGKRANTGFGAYRFSGLRYDVTDPDAPTTFPRFHETIYGGFGAISYPISKFRRLELGTSLNWSRKEIGVRNIDRDAWLLSNSLSLTHDETLYWLNGPVGGWRGRATLAYTTDIVYSNVSYFTLSADVRTYIRLHDQVTFASWFMGRMNEGREARLFVMGGSWDLRGFRFFEVRGQKIWFTSQELRFPLVNAPSVFLPFLAPFGVASLRGALFFDAAHAWNDGYRDVRPEINAGETIGAAGLGFRLNLFGSFVLRYDIGRRYRDGFRVQDKVFRQFMFGWDF